MAVSRISFCIIKQKPQAEHAERVYVHFHCVGYFKCPVMPFRGIPGPSSWHIDQAITGDQGGIPKIRHFRDIVVGTVFEDQHIPGPDISVDDICKNNSVI